MLFVRFVGILEDFINVGEKLWFLFEDVFCDAEFTPTNDVDCVGGVAFGEERCAADFGSGFELLDDVFELFVTEFAEGREAFEVGELLLLDAELVLADDLVEGGAREGEEVAVSLGPGGGGAFAVGALESKLTKIAPTLQLTDHHLIRVALVIEIKSQITCADPAIIVWHLAVTCRQVFHIITDTGNSSMGSQSLIQTR